MHSLVKLLAVCLALGQSQVGHAVPLEERSPCAIDDTIRLSLRDPAFAEEWSKRCLVEQRVEKRATATVYGSTSTTTTETVKTKADKTTSASSTPASSSSTATTFVIDH
ncbi:hypothetical protein LTR53_000483 [Teratosphaeriaceae sp. CCFEE 6253]|nr:hypothetical protein LTR53_000483 [Teratosphaeriaceae sp. CCFEE 6253]